LKAGFDRHWTRTINVYPAQVRLAVELQRTTRPGYVVLAPQWESMWIPTVHRHPFLFDARRLYQGDLADRLGKDEALRRHRLSLFVEDDEKAQDFEPACADLCGIDVVVVGKQAERARTLLRECGWMPDRRYEGQHVWVGEGGSVGPPAHAKA
jgi:hypothetical protein